MLLKLFALARGLAYAAAFVALWWWVVVSKRSSRCRSSCARSTSTPRVPRWRE